MADHVLAGRLWGRKKTTESRRHEGKTVGLKKTTKARRRDSELKKTKESPRKKWEGGNSSLRANEMSEANASCGIPRPQDVFE
jgi:hypothetical protein